MTENDIVSDDTDNEDLLDAEGLEANTSARSVNLEGVASYLSANWAA